MDVPKWSSASKFKFLLPKFGRNKPAVFYRQNKLQKCVYHLFGFSKPYNNALKY